MESNAISMLTVVLTTNFLLFASLWQVQLGVSLHQSLEQWMQVVGVSVDTGQYAWGLATDVVTSKRQDVGIL